jgi:uncharacterized protein YcgI (DUF1989 family)
MSTDDHVSGGGEPPLRAETDAVVVFSACPHDMLPVDSGAPTAAHAELS